MIRLLLCLLFTGCASAATRTDISIINRSNQRVTMSVGYGILNRTISLAPGEVWTGWVDSRFAGGKAEIVLK